MPQRLVTLHSGACVDVLNPSHDQLDVHDLAWGVAHQNRFNGHLHNQLDVATHSLALCALVPCKWRLRALLHDASEAILGDVVGPLKEAWQTCIYEMFDVAPWGPVLNPPEFDQLDMALTLHEAQTLGTSGFARSVEHLWPVARRLTMEERGRCTQPLLRRADMDSEAVANTWARMVFHHNAAATAVAPTGGA